MHSPPDTQVLSHCRDRTMSLELCRYRFSRQEAKMTNARTVLMGTVRFHRPESLRVGPASLLSVLVLLIAATTIAKAQTYTDLFNFDGTKHGSNPAFPGLLAQGSDGNLYGTAPNGGANGEGVVFKITPDGKPLTVLKSFPPGENPNSGLTLGPEGSFYGTTTAGGTDNFGTIFKITPSGTLTILYNFTGGADGRSPSAPPVLGSDGNLYGTTGGFSSTGTPVGTAYKITPSGTFTLLASLLGPANAPLVQGADGNFYGTTELGGSNKCGGGCGTVFKMAPEGAVNTVFRFDGADGASPDDLVLGSDGNFYGTAYTEGSDSAGVAYKLTPQGAITVLYDFNEVSGGFNPTGEFQATDGNFYGVAAFGAPGGAIFQITPAGAYSVAYSFDSPEGASPRSIPMQHTNGSIYGLTDEGGTFGLGVVYSFDLGLPPFAGLVSASGKVGKSIDILGQGFTGATSVSFNGTPATYSVASDTF